MNRLAAVLVLAVMMLTACVGAASSPTGRSDEAFIPKSTAQSTPSSTAVSASSGASSTSATVTPPARLPDAAASHSSPVLQAPRPTASPVSRDRAALWPVPDNHLTPGSIAALCPKERDVSTALKTVLRARYHITGRFTGEYDHRVPKFLCGADETACPARPDATCAAALDNLWPQRPDDLTAAACKGKPGCVINRKDQLETRIYNRLHAHPPQMTTPAAIAVFAAPADWRHEWCIYIHAPGDGVDCRGV
jgi:hypothetical protein